MILTTYTIATPAGVFQANWDDDEEIPVAYTGDADAIAFFRSFLELATPSGAGGALVRFDALEPDDFDFFQSDSITVIDPLPDPLDDQPDDPPTADDTDTPDTQMQTIYDSASDADMFTLIGEGAQLLAGLDENSDSFFADLGRLREIVLALGEAAPVDPAPEPEPAPVVPEPHGATKLEAAEALKVLRPFMSTMQMKVFADGARGEERQFFFDKAVEMADIIAAMPTSYDTDGQGMQAVAQLHYFVGGSDWYITEKDRDGDGTEQAFGYAILNGDTDMAELGYISIRELTSARAELDLHFERRALSTVVAPKLNGEETPPAIDPPAPVTVVTSAPSDEIMQKYIAIAADSIDKLRRIDVYRVLDALAADNPDGVTRGALATWIATKRPDLAKEVADVMAEEWPGDGWTSPTAAEPPATVTDPLPDGGAVVPPVVPAANGNRAADLDFLKAVSAQSIDMMADGVAERIETTLGTYPGDSEIEAAVRTAVASYTDYMTKAIGA